MCDGMCHPQFYACPMAPCAQNAEQCTIVGFDSNGTVASYTESCISTNSTCPCGNGGKKCTFKVSGMEVEECFATHVADEICPCKVGQQVCLVENFDTNGKHVDYTSRCVDNGRSCPCGRNGKVCGDTQDATNSKCSPQFAKDGGCPKPCTTAQEQAGNITCVKSNLNSTGHLQSKAVTCEQKCSIGRGQKLCKHGAVIISGFSCKDIYGLLGGTRRLAEASQIGQKETSSVNFALNNLATTSMDTSQIKPKLDSILQINQQLETSLIARLTGSGSSQAVSMQYKVTNLGASTVLPSTVTDQLRTYLNTENVAVKQALSGLGVVTLGARGCCSLSTVSKQASIAPLSEPSQETTTTNTMSTTTGQATTTNTLATTTAQATTTNTIATTTAQGMTTSTMSTTTGVGSNSATTTPQTVSVSYSGVVTLEATNVTRFLSDTLAQQAVCGAVASAADVSSTYVACEFSNGSSSSSRRLSEEEEEEEEEEKDEEEDEDDEQDDNKRRLAGSTSIRVDYTITLPATMTASDQATKSTSIEAMTVGGLNTLVKQKLADAGETEYVVTVTALTVVRTVNTVQTTTAGGDDSLENDDGSVMGQIGWTSLLLLLGTLFGT